jgi:hypothetical protein
MSKTTYNLRIEQLSESEFNEILNAFTSLGWDYNGSWKLAKAHQFAKFTWDNENKNPIYPKGFEPSTKVTPIETNKFSRPV